MARTIVIGDIHGCYDELVSLLDRVGLKPSDRVVAVGDLVTKGPKNRDVLELFRTDARFVSVLGNHELALLRFWRGEGNTLKNSQRTIAMELKDDLQLYCEFLTSLPLMIDLGEHVVVHAGVRPGVALEDQSAEDLLQLRTLGEDRTSRVGTPWFAIYEGPKTVLFGHWPSAEPIRAAHALGLDTGCVYGNYLTAYILEAAQLVSVPALHVYARPRNQLAGSGSN